MTDGGETFIALAGELYRPEDVTKALEIEPTEVPVPVTTFAAATSGISTFAPATLTGMGLEVDGQPVSPERLPLQTE